MENRNKKEKTSGLFTGLFCALAGAAVGIGGKLLYDEFNKTEQEKRQREEKFRDIPESSHQSKSNSISENQGSVVTTDSYECESFLCPISQEVMKDPVITPSGISYERKSILDWLKKNQCCPLTKAPLTDKDLVTNYALKSAIEDYYKNIKK